MNNLIIQQYIEIQAGSNVNQAVKSLWDFRRWGNTGDKWKLHDWLRREFEERIQRSATPKELEKLTIVTRRKLKELHDDFHRERIAELTLQKSETEEETLSRHRQQREENERIYQARQEWLKYHF